MELRVTPYGNVEVSNSSIREIKVQGAVLDFDFFTNDAFQKVYLLAGVNSFVHFYPTDIDESNRFIVEEKLEA
jgi:hypothetical protein